MFDFFSEHIIVQFGDIPVFLNHLYIPFESFLRNCKIVLPKSYSMRTFPKHVLCGEIFTLVPISSTQDWPLLVINGLITSINDRKQMGNWGL